MTADAQIAELASLVRDQMREIDRLRGMALQAERARAENARLKDEIDALVGWIGGDGDALSALQAIYANPRTPEAHKIKAAGLALSYERPKPPTMNVNAGVTDFREYVRTIRLRQAEKDRARWAAEEAAKVIEHQPAETILGGSESPDPAA
jgi:hypothetical protein